MSGSKQIAGLGLPMNLALALLCAGVIGMGNGAAQETKQDKKQAATERVVEGTVSDADGKFIDGAVVYLKDMRTLQVRSFYTQKNGGYHFSGLKLDNDYEIEGKNNDMVSGWKRLSIFDTRKVPVINLKLDKQEKAEAKK